jgi:hypothetical protein
MNAKRMGLSNKNTVLIAEYEWKSLKEDDIIGS